MTRRKLRNKWVRDVAADEALAQEIVTRFGSVAYSPELVHKLSLYPRLDEKGCWVWTGYIDPDGYGKFSKGARPYRLTWEWQNAEGFPKGLVPDHLCRNRACINPSHIEPVTTRVNILRGETITAVHAKKTHCPRGHKYNEENTYCWSGRRGRQCKTCMNEISKRWQAKRRQARGLKIGSKRSDTVLTEKQVARIKYRLLFGKDSKPKIAKDYGVVPGTIYKIANNETWRYVPWPTER